MVKIVDELIAVARIWCSNLRTIYFSGDGITDVRKKKASIQAQELASA
jgi:hypothetical protein